MIKKGLLMVALCFMLTGCSVNQLKFWTWWENEPPVHVGISEHFDFDKHKGIALVPFVNVGKKGFDTLISSKFCVHLMEQGFEVADHGLVQRILKDNNIDFSRDITLSSLETISKKTGMPVVGTGEVIWAMDDDADLDLKAVSIRLIDVKTGEVLISGYAKVEKDSSVSLVLSRKIAKKLFDLEKTSLQGN